MECIYHSHKIMIVHILYFPWYCMQVKWLPLVTTTLLELFCAHMIDINCPNPATYIVHRCRWSYKKKTLQWGRGVKMSVKHHFRVEKRLQNSCLCFKIGISYRYLVFLHCKVNNKANNTFQTILGYPLYTFFISIYAIITQLTT